MRDAPNLIRDDLFSMSLREFPFTPFLLTATVDLNDTASRPQLMREAYTPSFLQHPQGRREPQREREALRRT